MTKIAYKKSKAHWETQAAQGPVSGERTKDESDSLELDPVRRRQYQRKDIPLDVSLYSDSNFYAGFAENLSAGGVFVATHSQLPIGETTDLTITLPNDEQIRAHGIVRWLREYNESSDAPPGMGIQFLQIEGREHMDEFLGLRSPLFFDSD